jgi:mxaJ protein
VPLEIDPVTDTERFAPLQFSFDIAIGVKHGNDALRDELDRFVVENRPAIEAVLKDYGVPLEPLSAAALAGDRPKDDDD